MKHIKEFIPYYMSYSINWMCLLVMPLFIGLFIYGGAPILYVLSVLPAIILAYNIVSEYYAFMDWGHGKQLINIFAGACALVLAVVIAILLINQK